MVVKYVPYGSVRVSGRWRVILRAADKDRVRFYVTSGHRTLREQWKLFRQNMQFVRGRWVPRPGHPLTAFPLPTAPHIALGRRNHAIDVNSLDGGETRLQRWLERHGAHPTNPVPGEAWHMQLSGRDLRKLWRKFR
jgi:hypothetical protein